MAKPKVLVNTVDVLEVGLALLREECELVVVPCNNPSRETVLQHMPPSGVDAILWHSLSEVHNEIIDAAGPRLKAVAVTSAGYDHVDVDHLRERGVILGNAAGVGNDAVADAAVMLVLAVARRLQEARHWLERGECEAGRMQHRLGLDIAGSTVGVVGLGGIGQAFAKRMRAFNIGKIQYCGRQPKPEASELGAEFVSFDELITTSDIVVVVCPLTSETKNIFDAQTFHKMKSTSILVNVGRGGCVDQEALLDALQSKRIWGAGLDVTYPEPLPANHPLFSLENCVITPHIGAATVGCKTEAQLRAAKNILCVLKGEPMISPVCI